MILCCTKRLPLFPNEPGPMFQGLDKLPTATELPYKASKTGPLDEEEHVYNRALSRLPVKVENVLEQVKHFGAS